MNARAIDLRKTPRPLNKLRNVVLAAVFGVSSVAAALAVPPPTQVVAPVAPSAPPGSYRVTMAVALGAPDHWDYVFYDPSSERAFVAHGDRVTVIDAVTGAVVGEVLGTTGGAHGIAIVPDFHQGYTDDGTAGTVKIFDLKTLKVTKTVAVGADADGMVYDKLTGRIYVVAGGQGLTTVNPRLDDRTGSLAVGGKLETAVSDGAGSLYVNGETKREVVKIDTKNRKIDARWSIPTCDSPHGLAIDTAGRRLFVSCVNAKLLVLNADKGSVVATLPIGKGTDGAAYDPVRKRVFSSNGKDGTLTVIQQDNVNTYHVLNTVTTAVSARTMDIDPVSGRIFLAAAELTAPAPGSSDPPMVKPGSLKLLFLDPVK